YDSLTLQFNAQLATKLTSLASSLNVQIYQLDVASFFNSAVSNPSAYGFTNVTDSAYNGSTVVRNPDQYLFWDGVHPTRVGHSLLGQLASDTLDTHTWSGAGSSAWDLANNWSPQGAPQTRWIVNLTNDTGSTKTAVVSANSTVRKINIGGSGARMQVQVQSNVTLTASDSVTMANNSVLGVTLAGGGAQSKLSIGGEAALDGVLDVSLASGFIALPGTSYQVMSFGSHSGDLTVFNDTGFAGLSFDKSYKSTSLSLVASAVGGDANLDGMIDVNDLDLLAQHWQASGNWLGGDFNGDGMVDATDLGILATHWQGDASSLQTALQGISLPEPGVLSLIVLASLLTRYRGRMSSRAVLREGSRIARTSPDPRSFGEYASG
ncbi:MAG TPA: dockerin type I domain-containing protein, partial [Tepidisphaeraceae bacterium]